MTPIIGWAALAVSLVGLALAARSDRRGWPLRLGAGALWLAFAILNHSAVYITTSVLYIGVDLYGTWRRYRPTDRPDPPWVDVGSLPERSLPRKSIN